MVVWTSAAEPKRREHRSRKFNTQKLCVQAWAIIRDFSLPCLGDTRISIKHVEVELQVYKFLQMKPEVYLKAKSFKERKCPESNNFHFRYT